MRFGKTLVQRLPKFRALKRKRDLHEAGKEYSGWCVRCGRWQRGCEIDAERYHCSRCAHNTVFGLVWFYEIVKEAS